MDVVGVVRGWHRPLVISVGLWAGLVVVACFGLVVDHRTLVGEAVWVKPLKFGVAFGLYGGGLAWVLSRLREGGRVGWGGGAGVATSAGGGGAGVTGPGGPGALRPFH